MKEQDNYSDNVSNMDLLEKARAEFNREKRLVIKNLPHNTLEKAGDFVRLKTGIIYMGESKMGRKADHIMSGESRQKSKLFHSLSLKLCVSDIRAFMGFNGEFPIEEVQMVKHVNQAMVTLKDPSLADDVISKLNNTKFEKQTVTVAVYRSEKILCVAHLPTSMAEYKFRELVSQHGNIDMCFLMRAEETGESKGYGFVEYNEPIEKVGQIKFALDWLRLEDHLVHCDAIVDCSQTGITFEDLHSTCLLIDNLPSDYTDSIVLRELFSQLVKPVYCQIVTKENVSLGFGILEYENATDAEEAYNKFKDHEINGVAIHISYCIPGKSAVHMFNRIMFKYGDSVHVNKASLLPDPVYPNPAFLKNSFFKTHVAKHPRLLVQFTDNLLHLQEGYVKQLEDKTNTKPGILGPAPTIPMSPLMDVNLQLGLLSVIVLDMRQKGTYNGEVPEPLGKLKVPTEEEFQQKPEPVSLLGDPLTAQANIILKNLLMPPDNPEFQPRVGKSDSDAPKLLDRPIQDFNLVYLCSLGRMMAMMSEKSQNMGLLGNAPTKMTGPPKPLLEGLMQASKVAQKLLNSIGMNQLNQPNNQTNNSFMNQQHNQSQSLLGEPPNMNRSTNTMSSNFMNSVQALAFQKMKDSKGGNSGNNSLLGNMGNFNNNSGSGDGLLGSYQGPGQSKMNQPPSLRDKPQSLLNLNLNTKGEGLIPIPDMEDEQGFYGNQGHSNNYDDSGYQGGYDDSDGQEIGNYDNSGMGNYGNQGSNYGNTRGGNYNNMMGTFGNQNMGNLGNQNMGNLGNKNMGNLGNQNMGNLGNQNSMSNLSNLSSMGNYGNMGSNANNMAGMNRRTGGIKSLMSQDFTSNSERFDGAYFSGINARQKPGQNMQKMGGMDKRDGQYTSMAEKAAMYAAGAAAAYKQQYEAYIAQQQGTYGGGGYTDNNDYNSYQDSGQNSMTDNFGGSSFGADNSGSFSNSSQGGFGPIGNMRNTSNRGNTNLFAQSRQNMGSLGATGSFGRQSDSLMGPPQMPSWGSGISQTSLNTPQSQKRPFSHILQSPEPSPEGDYIGQHSQGLGGHYAETYTKRQKLSGRFT